MPATIISNIYFLIGIGSATFSILQLSRMKKYAVNFYLILLYFVIAYMSLYYWAFKTGILAGSAFLFFTDIIAAFALGPFLYLYFKNLPGETDKFPWKSLAHFIPAILALCILPLLPAGRYAVYYAASRPPFPHYIVAPPVFFLSIAADISMAVYMLLTLREIYTIYRSKYSSIKEMRYLIFFPALFVLGMMMILILYFTGNDILIAAVTAANGIVTLVYFLFSYRHPEITQRVIRAPGAKSAASLPEGIDVAGITGRLMELIEKEHVYRDSRLTLQTLSSRLGINNHILTLILNDKMHMNFRSFINFYRLREAKSLLGTSPEMSIQEIAHAAGFNSRTVFNTAFLKDTGLSPGEYREKSRRNT